MTACHHNNFVIVQKLSPNLQAHSLQHMHFQLHQHLTLGGCSLTFEKGLAVTPKNNAKWLGMHYLNSAVAF